jgi:hypothetical protein
MQDLSICSSLDYHRTLSEFLSRHLLSYFMRRMFLCPKAAEI